VNFGHCIYYYRNIVRWPIAVPYTDPEQRRLYNREYARFRRSGSCQTPGQSQLPAEFRLQTARDILDLLSDQIQAVHGDGEVKTVERARTIGYLGGDLDDARAGPAVADSLWVPRPEGGAVGGGRHGFFITSPECLELPVATGSLNTAPIALPKPAMPPSFLLPVRHALRRRSIRGSIRPLAV
jgi:hypothetical protein